MKSFLAIKRPENIDDIPEWPMMTWAAVAILSPTVAVGAVSWQPNERRRDALVLKLGL
jgi:hypothetical protein